MQASGTLTHQECHDTIDQNGAWVTIESLNDAIEHRSARSADAIALGDIAGDTITFRELDARTRRLAESLCSAGVSQDDVVAVCTARGVPAAVAFLGTARVAAAAPLNIQSPASEIAYALDDLNACAVVVDEGTPDTVIDAASTRRLAIVHLDGDATSATFVPAEPDSAALILHTSGTTAAPKSVPLSHRNLLASASTIANTLALSETDHCLGIMPLFHIHGIVGCLLSTLVAGGSITCTPGFDAPRITEWIEQFDPTWYSGVPTMHNSIAERLNSMDRPLDHRLRFARSSSSAMPPTVMEQLESALSIPVIEAYGMTEASHQMTSNQLPPSTRKPGTVGVAAGAEVRVVAGTMDCSPGEEGEIIIRGPGVFAGYRNNPQATAEAFVDGWFRTGDLGHLKEGLLTISGRLKEIINRGGEKISPRQIDEAMMSHPSVSQAMAFAVPDDALGERVVAVCVLTPGIEPDHTAELAIRRHVEERLDAHKIPERVIFLKDIPKGATGKPQRIGLAERIGFAFESAPHPVSHQPPGNDVEEFIAGLWSEVLGIDDPSVGVRFLDAGGDSMLAARLISRVEGSLGLSVSMVEFFDRATIEDQAVYIARLLTADEPS